MNDWNSEFSRVLVQQYRMRENRTLLEQHMNTLQETEAQSQQQ